MKIAIVGSPGSGKSTLCAGIFYYLKLLGEHVEMVPELIKYKVYKNLNFIQDGFDIQNTLEQKEFEEIFDTDKAKSQIDYIICEAPLCNGYFYSDFYKKELESPILKKIAESKINSYDIILFVKRVPDAEYVSFGRKETENQSQMLEDHIESKIKELKFNNNLIILNQKTNIRDILEQIGIPQDKLIKFDKIILE